MRQTIMILATALLASSLLTVAAEARRGGGGFGRGDARIGSDRMHFDGIDQNTMRRFDSSYYYVSQRDDMGAINMPRLKIETD